MLLKKIPFTAIAAITVSTVMSMGAPQAADLSLSNIPLYLSQDVPPNILFLLDDSGSMDWEVMMPNPGAQGTFRANQPDGNNVSAAGAAVQRGTCTFGSSSFGYGYMYSLTLASNTYSRYRNGEDCNTAADASWRFRNADFNSLYYDPTQTYAPWVGVDDNGNAFGNYSVTAAPDDPFDPNETIDLTRGNCPTVGGTRRGMRYYDWNDDGDGVFENGEETVHFICDLSNAQKTNFANWFSYYRSREFVAKAAYGRVIAQASDVRMGLVTLHNNNSVNTAIAQMNADPTTGAKRALLDKLYTFRSNNGTNLRQKLQQCGEYLSCDSTALFSSCPALSRANGGECQQNFVIMMTDGFYNGSDPSVGNTDGPGAGNTAFDGGAYADGWSDTLADVAMEYYENDIHPGLANRLPVTLGVDEAEHQHVVTYSVAFGVTGSLTPADLPSDRTQTVAWPDPDVSDSNKIDDLLHASFNGRGQFLQASNSQQLIDALNDAIASISGRTSSASSAAVNTGTLNTSAQIYQARFNSTDWSGEFLAYSIDLNGDIVLPALGEAGAILTAVNWNSGREIITFQDGVGVPFRWSDGSAGHSVGDPELSNASRRLLKTNPDTGLIDNGNAGRLPNNTGNRRWKYLRGQQSLEGVAPYLFRARNTVLGDIVHSSPVYIGPDSIFPYPDNLEGNTSAASYYQFVTDHIVDRKPMIYVGANDGFLHAFDGIDGDEDLAYLPGILLPFVNQLTSSSYVHRPYVDGKANFQDVYFDSAWHTVLVGSLRQGGQGFYALDVTDPGHLDGSNSTFDESNAEDLALWEFSDSSDNGVDATGYPDLGYSYGQASIVRLANGRWAAIVGNGYNATEADGHASTTGDAALYIIDIEDGTVIRKITTGVGMAEDPTGGNRPNGLAAPAPVDINGDFIADYVYAGDLFGNLWKFDLQDSNPANWDIPFTASGNPAPLFVAQINMATSGSADIQRQPITVRPEVGVHPDGQGVLVYFGTGQYIETTDHTAVNQITQTFYAVWDKLPASSGSPPGITRSNMLQQEIVEELTVPTLPAGDTYNVRVTTQRGIDWTCDPSDPTDPGDCGWYIDLYNTNSGSNNVTVNLGERQVSDPVLRNGRIIFTTLLPSEDICSFGGTGWLMEFDAYEGGRLGYTPFDVDGNGDFGTSDYVTVTVTTDDNGDGNVTTVTVLVPVSGKESREGMMPEQTIIANQEEEFKYNSGTTGEIEVTRENPGPSAEGRTSWQLLQ